MKLGTLMEFDKKVVLVTGAAGAGIGQAVARGFSALGAIVVLSDKHEARTNKVASEIADETGNEVIGITFDTSEESQVERAIDQAIGRCGSLDIVVNNAGLNSLSPLHEMPVETWRRVIDVSLTGTFLVTRRALVAMRQQNSGVIVNLSSIAGWMGTNEGEAHYAAAKAGIMGFTRASAIEAAPFGIRVNAVAPGLAWNSFLAKVYSTDYIDEMARQTPLGRVGTPEDVANAVLFLASDKASFITGEVLCVSGGYHLHT
jgi:3-oxoacyl-[acyl-carrier protein] reductase